jgi:hypothetical protein
VETVFDAAGPVMRRALEEPAALWCHRKLKLVLDGIAASRAPT